MKFWFIFLVAIVGIGGWYFYQLPSVVLDNAETGYVTHVIDGDTIDVLMNNQVVRVRYIGVDTPETVDPNRAVGCYGKQASNKNKQLVEHKQVQLVKDTSQTDAFGRLLRYVFVSQLGGKALFVNQYLIEEGYARVLTKPPDTAHQEEFKQMQDEARLQQKGLWKECS